MAPGFTTLALLASLFLRGGWLIKLLTCFQSGLSATLDREVKREEILVQHAKDEHRERYVRQKLRSDFGYKLEENDLDNPLERM